MTNKNSNTTQMDLPSDREIMITRVFDAPRSLVFKAYTRPEHVTSWYGLHGLTFIVCEIDLRIGGRWRYVLQGSEGQQFGFSGEYREVLPPERLVYTEGFEGMPGHEYLVTLTLAEENGQTTFRSHLLYQSQADRDGHIASGMEGGMRVTLDRLEEVLKSLQ